MTMPKIVESKYFKGAAIVCGIVLVALISFAAGVKVGVHKALFSARFGENYERNFMGGEGRDGRNMPPMKKMMDKVTDKGMRNAHGVAGEILSVNDNTLIVKDRDNQESTIRMSEATIVNRGKDTVDMNTLTVGERIVVVGKPQEDGVIAAHLIRIFQNDNSR